MHSAYYQTHDYKPNLHQAIEEGKLATVEQWLKEKGTKVNELRGGTASHSHFYVAGGTALHWAAYYGQLEIANLLLENGAGAYLIYCSVVLNEEESTSIYIGASYRTSFWW